MISDETNAPRTILSRRFGYGALALACSFIVTFRLVELGCEMIPAVAVSVFCILLVLSRWQIVAIVIPLALFYAVVFGGIDSVRLTAKSGQVIEGQLLSDDGSQVVIRDGTGMNRPFSSTQVAKRDVNPASKSLVFLSLMLLASSFRFCACLPSDRPSTMLTARLNFTPISPTSVGSSLHWAESMSLVSIFAALGLSTVLCSPLNQQLRSGPHIGLIPEAYFAIKTVLLMGVLIALSRGALSYLAMLKDGGSLASLQLRRELWKCTGSEERRIARQLRRS